MKIWHLIISYLFCATFWIFTVGMFKDYFCILTLIAIVTPLSFMLFKDEKYYNKFYNRGAQCIIASFFVALIGFFSFLGYTRGEFSNSLVAITDNIETATKIENILFENFTESITREHDERNGVAILLETTDKQTVAHAIVEIAMSKDFDSTIHLPVDVHPVKNKEDFIKKISKDLRKKISSITHVIDAAVEIGETKPNEDEELIIPQYPTVSLYISTTNCADRHEIIRVSKNLLLGSMHGLTDKNITIEFIRDDCIDKRFGYKCEPKPKDFIEDKCEPEP